MRPISLQMPPGFTLLEMAMVLLVMGLLLGGFLTPLSVLHEADQRQEADGTLRDIHDTLLGFVITHGHFPCPDTDGDGREDRNQGQCVGLKEKGEAVVAQLPHITLGLGRLDPWGNRFTYAVDPLFADSRRTPLPMFTSADPGNIVVTNGTDHTPTLVLSHGGNGFGAINAANLPQVAPKGLSEIENSDHDSKFVLDDYSEGLDNPFDDRMIWISPHLLANHMLQSGKPLTFLGCLDVFDKNK